MVESAAPDGAADAPLSVEQLDADAKQPDSAAIDTLLDVVEAPPPESLERAVEAADPVVATAAAGLRSARLVSLRDEVVQVLFRGQKQPVAAKLADEVDIELVRRALEVGDSVLVESGPGAAPLVVGVLMTRLPKALHLEADEIHVEARKELLLRSGRAALRLRQDGDVELVGTRIHAASRGLFKLVGRILRLN